MIKLRKLEKKDLSLRVSLLNNKDINDTLNVSEKFNIEDTYKWFSSIEDNTSRFDCIFYIGNDIIGMGGLTHISLADKNASLYIYLDTKFQGRGYGSQSLDLLCNYGFCELNLHKIYLYTFINNERANSMYEKMGFVKEGHLRQHTYKNGKLQDRFIYGLLKEEYKKNNNMNILFTCAGRRGYLINYFKQALGDNGKVIATDLQLSAPALQMADIAIQTPGVYEDNYIDNLLKISKEYNVKAIISLNDLELPILATNRSIFEENGIKLIVSSPEVIDICFDKYKTAKYITTLGLLTPITYIDLDEAKQALIKGSLKFPLVVKPRWGSGSIGIEFVEDLEELDLVYQLLKKKIKKTILSNTCNEDQYILIQQKISGEEYGIDILNDLEGNFCSVSVKKKLAMRAGETDKAITVQNDSIELIAQSIGENLKHVANLDCDILYQDGKYYVLELNPRFGGGYPFSHESGMNIPKILLSWLDNKEPDPVWFHSVPGNTFSKCDNLVKIDI